MLMELKRALEISCINLKSHLNKLIFPDYILFFSVGITM
jgi:hypothetical protein